MSESQHDRPDLVNARTAGSILDSSGETKMQIHGIANLHGAQPLSGPHRAPAASATPPADAWSGVDELELSPEANLVNQVRDLPDVRADRVAEIRAQIADGVYETDEKLEVAVGRLFDEISG